MDPTQYKTSDLAYAAYLKMADVAFLGTEKEGSRTMFIFERVEGIRDLKMEFFGRRKIKMSPLSYYDEIKALKTMVHMDEG